MAPQGWLWGDSETREVGKDLITASFECLTKDLILKSSFWQKCGKWIEGVEV